MENCVITTYRNFTKFYLSEGYQKSIHFFLEGGGNSFARFRKCRTQQISKFAILFLRKTQWFWCYSNGMYMVGIFQYIPQNSHPGPQPLLMSIYHWHCQVAGTSASVAPQRHKARCAEKRRREKTARARRGGTTAPREDRKHGAGQRRVEQRKFKWAL